MRVQSLFISEKLRSRNVILTRAGESSSYASSGDSGENSAVGEDVEGPSGDASGSACMISSSSKPGSSGCKQGMCREFRVSGEITGNRGMHVNVMHPEWVHHEQLPEEFLNRLSDQHAIATSCTAQSVSQELTPRCAQQNMSCQVAVTFKGDWRLLEAFFLRTKG